MAGALIDVTSDEWGTPSDFFYAIQKIFGEFDLDAAADDDWHYCEKYITKKQNALDPKTEWNGLNIWLNPPYGKMIPPFLDRVLLECSRGKTVTCLLPAKIDVVWFHDVVAVYSSDLLFVKGRINFKRRNGEKAQTGLISSIVVRFTPESIQTKAGPKVGFLKWKEGRKKKHDNNNKQNSKSVAKKLAWRNRNYRCIRSSNR